MLQYKRLLETWVNIQNPDDFTFTKWKGKTVKPTPQSYRLVIKYGLLENLPWLVVWNIFYFPFSWEESSQLTFIFFRWLVIPPSSSILYDFPSQKPSCMYWMFPWFSHDFPISSRESPVGAGHEPTGCGKWGPESEALEDSRKTLHLHAFTIL